MTGYYHQNQYLSASQYLFKAAVKLKRVGEIDIWQVFLVAAFFLHDRNMLGSVTP